MSEAATSLTHFQLFTWEQCEDNNQGALDPEGGTWSSEVAELDPVEGGIGHSKVEGGTGSREVGELDPVEDGV